MREVSQVSAALNDRSVGRWAVVLAAAFGEDGAQGTVHR
jgi:hypothetical protein